MHRTPTPATLRWILIGALSGFLALLLCYAGHSPAEILARHRSSPAFLLIDTAPLLLAWIGWQSGRLGAAEARLAALGSWADGALERATLNGVLLVGADGKIVDANHAARLLLGHPDPEGLSLRAVLPDHAQGSQQAHERSVPFADGDLIGVEWSMTARHAGGGTFPVWVHSGPATQRRVIYVLRPIESGHPEASTPAPQQTKHTLIPGPDSGVTGTVPATPSLALVDHRSPDTREELRQQLDDLHLSVCWSTPDPQALAELGCRGIVLTSEIDEQIVYTLIDAPELAGMPLLIATSEHPLPSPSGPLFYIGEPLDAVEIQATLRLAERTFLGCLIVGDDQRATALSAALEASGWRTERQPTLGDAEAALAQRRRALVVWIRDEPAIDLGAFPRLQQGPGAWLGPREHAPPLPGWRSVTPSDDPVMTSQRIIATLHRDQTTQA